MWKHLHIHMYIYIYTSVCRTLKKSHRTSLSIVLSVCGTPKSGGLFCKEGCFEGYSKELRAVLCGGLFGMCVVLQRVEGCFDWRLFRVVLKRVEGFFMCGAL